MKYKIVFGVTIFLILISCNEVGTSNNEFSTLETKHDSLKVLYAKNNTKVSSLQLENNTLKTKLKTLSDSLILLKFSSKDRFNKINQLIKENKLNDAKTQIIELKNLFPSSIETVKCIKLESLIQNKEKIKKKEEERKKALGYKAFKDNTSSSKEKVSFKLSRFRFGRRFTSDYCPDVNEYSYQTADKGNTYLLVSLALSTKEKYASCPSFYLYEIDNGNLKKLTYFQEAYTSWTSYGAKVGNYNDDSHDFSKVNTVKYNLAAEINKEYSKKPLIMVLKKIGRNVKEILTIDEARNDYIIVKIINRNKF
jgi:hypothetical protein